MIRRVIIVILTLAGIGTALAWATSFDDVSLDAHLGGYDSRVVIIESGAAFYLTSARGWLRTGVLRMDPEWDVPPLAGSSRGFWAGVVSNPDPRFDGRAGHKLHLWGLAATCNRRLAYARLTGFAIPHWTLCAALLAYPMLAFIRGPLRRYRRRRKGLCIRCGYDLTGNISGVCPECGAKVEEA